MAKCHNIPLKQIAELNPNLTNWKIKANVSFTNEKEKVKPISTGKICKVTLEDESGKIAGISYGDIAECIALHLTNFGKYYITGANIREAHSPNNIGHKYELHFVLNKTEFEDVCSGKLFRLDDEAISRCERKVCESGNSSAAGGSGGINFKPTPLEEVLGSQNLLDSKKFDILAILKKTEKSEPLYNNENTQIGRSNRFYRKKVTIIDETGEVILRLASELKKKFEEHLWLKRPVMVIAVKECIWKKYGNTVVLTGYLKNMVKEEKLLKTPAIASRIKELKSWYHGKKKKASKDLTSKGCAFSNPHEKNNGTASLGSESVNLNPRDRGKKRKSTTKSDVAGKKMKSGRQSITKGDFSHPDEKKNRAESLGSESEKLSSRDATKMINSGVAGKKRKLPTSKGNKQHGEKLRKTDDNCGPYIDGEIFHKMQVGKRIGCIQFERNNSCGTGFRVGSKYVITAFHVMEDILIRFWKHVHKFLSVKERKEIKWTKDILPVAGSWNLSKLFSSLDPSKREYLLEIGKQEITESCQIEIEFKEMTRGTFFKFSHDPVAFASKKDDVLILELAERQDLPEPLILTDYSIPGAKLHLFGHPDKKILQHDPGCRIIEDKAELSAIVEEGISFFTEKGFDIEEVKEDYASCKLSRDHILFHCSKSFAHGASGAPLMVVSDKARVLGMLQTGHPKLYYNHCKYKPLEGHPELLLEYGISMKKVKSLLENHSLFQLSNDLFSHELSSQMIQDVETLTFD